MVCTIYCIDVSVLNVKNTCTMFYSQHTPPEKQNIRVFCFRSTFCLVKTETITFGFSNTPYSQYSAEKNRSFCKLYSLRSPVAKVK